MSLPRPLPGLVIHYDYLWHADHVKGRETSGKDRPAAIIMAVDTPGTEVTRVYVLAITHSAPAPGIEALEIPAAVRRAEGLDAAPCWAILSEFNEFVWPGYDLQPVPGRNPKSIAYGFLTPGFFSTLRSRWLALDTEAKTKGAGRDK